MLYILSSEHKYRLEKDELVSIAAFTDATDWWTSEKSQQHADQILQSHLADEDRDAFILELVVKGLLRGVFAKKPPRGLTASGRKAAYPSAPSRPVGESLDAAPWKTDVVYAVTVLAWAVQNISVSEVCRGQRDHGRRRHGTLTERTGPPIIQADGLRRNWAAFTPLLLAVVDDADTAYRVRGLGILRIFVERAPAEVLSGKTTGLGDVFEDAVTPALHFLPSLVPEGESATLLQAAYGVLIALAKKLRPSQAREGGQAPAVGQRDAAGLLLSRVLRDGVFVGYSHAKEYPGVVDVLTVVTRDIMNELGIDGIVYLKVCSGSLPSHCYHIRRQLTNYKDVIPFLAEVISEPFLTGRPHSLTKAVLAMQAVIVNCWPRVSQPQHRYGILQAITMCWMNVTTEETSIVRDLNEVERLKAELKRTVALLPSLDASSETPMSEDARVLTLNESRLKDLFAPLDSGTS